VQEAYGVYPAESGIPASGSAGSRNSFADERLSRANTAGVEHDSLVLKVAREHEGPGVAGRAGEIPRLFQTSASTDAGDGRRQVRNGRQAASRNVVTCGSPVTPVGGNSPRSG
jgi:hypothetical protein